MNIEDIKKSINNHRIRITDHADEEAEADGLTFDEIFFFRIQWLNNRKIFYRQTISKLFDLRADVRW
jgi:hypothetical protein